MRDESNDWVRRLIARSVYPIKGVLVHLDSRTVMFMDVEFGKRNWR